MFCSNVRTTTIFLFASVAAIVSPFRAHAQRDTTVVQKRQALNAFEGTWNVTVEHRLSAQGPWETTRGRSDIGWIVGGTLLKEDLTTTRERGTFRSMNLIAVNGSDLRYQLVTADSEHGDMLEFAGTSSGDSLVFGRQWRHPQGYDVRFRIVYLRKGMDAFTVENMRMTPNMTSWDVTGRRRYVRSRE